MKHGKFYLGAVAVLGSAFAFSVVFAAPTNKDERKDQRDAMKDQRVQLKEERADLRQQIKEEREEIKEERKENREQLKEKRCENVEKRIKNRVNRYENKQSQETRVFGNLVSRLNNLVSYFEEKDLDVTELKADAVKLEQLVQELDDAHAEFIAGLKDSQEQACGESEGEFLSKLGESRRMVPEVREKLEAVRDYYKDVVRPDILDLRNQLVEDEDEETEEDDDDEDKEVVDEEVEETEEEEVTDSGADE